MAELDDEIKNPVSAIIQARKVLRVINGLKKEFGSSAVDDPVWKILLKLFISFNSEDAVSVTELCKELEIPMATCLRHVSILVTLGIVHRKKDPSDKRRVYVFLTEKSVLSLTKVLADKELPVRSTGHLLN